MAIKKPKAIKAPGAKTNTNKPSPSINFQPKMERLPITSLTVPKMVRAKAKPNPIPKPSTADDATVFLEAKASALPNTIQFTTINGINKPNCACNAGKKPAITKSTMVTKEAIITINEGILTLSGIRFLTSAITVLDISNTKVVAKPIPNPFMAVEVTPKVGHNPSSKLKTGFSRMKPFKKFSLDEIVFSIILKF